MNDSSLQAQPKLTAQFIDGSNAATQHISPNPAGGPELFADRDTMDIQHDWMNTNCGDCAKRHKLTLPQRQHQSWIRQVHHQ